MKVRGFGPSLISSMWPKYSTSFPSDEKWPNPITLIPRCRNSHNPLQYDCVTFHIFVSGLRTTENAMKSAGWMLLDAAEALFLTARSRVYGPEDGGKSKKQKTEEGGEEDKLFKFDVNPKWTALTEIMSDIRKEIEENQVTENALGSLACKNILKVIDYIL